VLMLMARPRGSSVTSASVWQPCELGRAHAALGVYMGRRYREACGGELENWGHCAENLSAGGSTRCTTRCADVRARAPGSQGTQGTSRGAGEQGCVAVEAERCPD